MAFVFVLFISVWVAAGVLIGAASLDIDKRMIKEGFECTIVDYPTAYGGGEPKCEQWSLKEKNDVESK